MPQQQADRLAALERDVLDRTVPLADVLRSCLALSRHTQATQLREWVTAELKGYRIDGVPDYRKIAGSSKLTGMGFRSGYRVCSVAGCGA